MAKSTGKTATASVQSEYNGEYSIDDLAAHAKVLGASPDIIRAALRRNKVTNCTISEAKTIIAKFVGGGEAK